MGNDEGQRSAPPFLGSKVVEDVSLDAVTRLVDEEALFASRWQFRQQSDAKAWEDLKQAKVLPLYSRLILRCRREELITPKIVYGYFACRQQGNGLIVSDAGRAVRFDFPREGRMPHRCIADFFADGFVAMQLVTVGTGVVGAATDHFANGQYSEAFFLKGLASAMAEAVAVFGHQRIREELGVGSDVGERFSPGYASFPNLLDQKKLFSLLRPDRIGVTMTRTCQLIPEYSTSAIISVDDRAQHFHP